MKPLYETEAGGRRVWTLLLLLACAVAAIVAVALAVGSADSGSVVALLLVALTCGGLALIVPTRYEIAGDGLTIVFPLWRWQIPFETIDSVREARGFEPYGFLGVRFATAPGQAVTVIRREANLLRRPNLVISPHDRAEFLARLRQAWDAGAG